MYPEGDVGDNKLSFKYPVPLTTEFGEFGVLFGGGDTPLLNISVDVARI